MNIFQKFIVKVDSFQQKHKSTAFSFAVIKKYSDDRAGYQAALVTYYGFLSLFPLLLILSTVATIAGTRNPAFGDQLVNSVSSYFPGLGESLNNSIKGASRTGPALLIGLLFALYGARGVADAFRHAANNIWHVPMARRSGFPRSQIRSFCLIVGAGCGFIAAAIITGYAATSGSGMGARMLSIACNLVILYGVFVFIMRLSLPLSIPVKKFRFGAAFCAVGVTVLQQLGTILLAHHAKGLSSAYSAVLVSTLGLIAWIYLQSQVVMYAMVIDTVRDGNLWPRSLSGQKLTSVDKRIKEARNTHQY